MCIYNKFHKITVFTLFYDYINAMLIQCCVFARKFHIQIPLNNSEIMLKIQYLQLHSLLIANRVFIVTFRGTQVKFLV